MAIQKVGVVGCGAMGSGIAQVCAQYGFKAVVQDISQEMLDRGQKKIFQGVDKLVKSGKIEAGQAEQIKSNIETTLRLEDLGDCDLIVEAAFEEKKIKNDIFRALDGCCKPETVFSSNTSSIPIIELASATKRPDKVIGLHFFNPVPVMRLVEIIKTISSSEEAVDIGKQFVQSINKSPIVAPDLAGFIVNRLLIVYLMEAIRMYEYGLATKEDIDQGMVLGANYPMGPFTLMDFLGLDVTAHICDILFEEFKDAHLAAPPLLKRLVAAGHYGRKTGRGFYDYSAGKK